ncbi:MAG TPA: DUF1801 domain-containing protein [Steroidobacteraceae bacterium]|nr:DUF1801 domain-containing protein [Steroidobacteraceae bacterium]
MRFASAVRRDPAIDPWLASRGAGLAPLARHWFNRMRGCGPDMRELMHDGCPVACVGDIALGYVNVFKAHVNVGFFLGADLDDPAGLLQGAGRRMRHVKLRADAPLDNAALERLIEDAYAGIHRRTAAQSP